MKTISIPEDLHKELVKLKLDYGDRNIAEMIRKLVLYYKQQKFLEHSRKFREILKKEGKSFDDFLEELKEVRKEIANERFSKN
jgi:predicted CopG family antitoxin